MPPLIGFKTSPDKARSFDMSKWYLRPRIFSKPAKKVHAHDSTRLHI